MMLQHFGEQFRYDDNARSLLGLSSFVLKGWGRDTNNINMQVLSIDGDVKVSRPLENSPFQSIADFEMENSVFGNNLVELVNSFSLNLV